MKNLKLIVIAFCLSGYVLAEAQEVIATGGDFHSNANGSVSSTIGQPIGETFTGTVNVLTQGFQQEKLLVTAIKELPGLTYSISAFPNPTRDLITIKVENSKDEVFSYGLYGLTGKLIQQNQFECPETEISISHLASSTYFVKIYSNQKEVKSFKIVKQ
jgi:hypothetical protein